MSVLIQEAGLLIVASEGFDLDEQLTAAMSAEMLRLTLRTSS